MRGKFVLAPNGDQLVPSCLSVVQGVSAFQGVRSEGFNCIPLGFYSQRSYLKKKFKISQ